MNHSFKELISIVAVIVAMLFSSIAYSSNNNILVVLSTENSLYTDYFEKLSGKIRGDSNISHIYAKDISPDKLQQADLVISVGAYSKSKLINFQADINIIYTLLSEQSFTLTERKQCIPPGCYAIYIEQPTRKYLSLIKTLFGTNRTIRYVSSDKNNDVRISELKNIANEYNISLDIIYSKSSYAFTKEIRPNDVLLALPDPSIYNRNTAKNIILAAYHKDVPIIAYSKAFTKAGALASLYSSIDNIAEQTSDLINDIQKNIKPIEKGYYPDSFSIEINMAVANSLGISIPEIDVIKRKIKQ